MADTKLDLCSCKHEFQDEKYGKQVRVWNKIKSDPAAPKWRCTVCGRDR